MDKKTALRKIMYKKGIALSGFTKYKCSLCKKTETWHNSLTPDFCKQCAEKIINQIFD